MPALSCLTTKCHCASSQTCIAIVWRAMVAVSSRFSAGLPLMVSEPTFLQVLVPLLSGFLEQVFKIQQDNRLVQGLLSPAEGLRAARRALSHDPCRPYF
jgi:hypothetical protein